MVILSYWKIMYIDSKDSVNSEKLPDAAGLLSEKGLLPQHIHSGITNTFDDSWG